MEPKSFGRDTVVSIEHTQVSHAVITSTQLVQYDDDEENEDKLDSSRSEHRAPSREGIEDVGGGGPTADPHLGGQSNMASQPGMGVSLGELAPNVGGSNVIVEIDRGVEGEEHEGHDVSEGDMVPQEGVVAARGNLASVEAMRVSPAYGTTDVGHGDLTAPSAQGAGDGVNEYVQEDELQERTIEGVLEEAPVDQAAYIVEGVAEGTSSFSELQQTQLRAQILVYGDLINGVLPEHNLMLTAFQDGPEAFGQESDRSNTSGWNWEQHWQVAAMKQQSELERQAEEELAKDKGDVTMADGEQLENALPETLEPGTPLTAPSRVAEQSLKEQVYPTVVPGRADLSVAHVDGPSIDVNEDSTVNLDVVVDNIVAATVSSISSAPLQPGANPAPDSGVIIGTSAASPEVAPTEDVIAIEAVHSAGTRSPSLDPWLKTPFTAQRPPLGGAVAFSNPSPQSAAWPVPSHPINFAHSSQEGGMSMPSTNVPRADITPNSTQYPSHPVNGGIETGVTPISLGVADNVEEEPVSRKRKKGAGKTREKKATAAATTTTTPRPRSRARKGLNTAVASPSTTIDPTFPTPSPLIYESSAAAGVASATSPTSPLASNVGERRDGLAIQSLHTDTANWVEQARVSFEEAMSAANSAQHESQLVNAQAPQNRISGNEAKYASAADAVKVAASVAKAAANAAKVAYEAALQARLFVFEGVEGSSGRTDKDGGAGGRRSAIAAAKEEARKRASGIPSAIKANPQSTDAVLRAAKLMTEAAAEAGAVLAKGNATPSRPLLIVPLSVASEAEEERKIKSSDRRGRPRKADTIGKSVDEPAAEKKPVKTPKDSKQSWKKGARRKGKEAVDAVASAAKTPPKKTEDSHVKQSPEKPIRRQLEQAMTSASKLSDSGQSIAEGSLVEVMNDEEGLRGGWFSAQVLEVKDGQAYVQYDEILTDDGKTKLMEWFPLEGKLEGPEPGRPRIRLVTLHNMAREEGGQEKQRKRRRTATKDRIWAVGDRADAFVQDGWWEGIVKSFDEEENKVIMHFPGEGDTQIVKVKNSRPSLVWKDGKWEQWTSGGNTQSVKKDEEPSAKRQKVGTSPKAQARKIRQKSSSDGKVSEEGKESPRTTRRGKPVDSHGEIPPSPAVVNTRSSPRQKLPAKRKDGATKLASPESEVSTPNQVSTPVSTRARSLPQDAVNSVTEPSKGRTPASGSASQKKSHLSQKVGKKNLSKENGETPPNRRNLRNSKEQTPSPVIGTPTTRQKAKAGASTQNQMSARV